MSQTKSFFHLRPVRDALDLLYAEIASLTTTEAIPTALALGRVLAEAVVSPMDLPAFVRSTMDGYAVKAADTFGASDALPAYLTIVGEVQMGEVPTLTLESAQTVEIHTGAMLPDGADAVVMVERTQRIGDGEIEVLAPVAVGENILQIGEDVRHGEMALKAGHRLRPQDIGALLAVGITIVQVKSVPRVGILSCGDELVPAEDDIELGQVRDINSHTLAALVRQAGAAPVLLGIARDTMDSLLPMAQAGLAATDILLLSAGSSVSARDLTHDVITQLGAPGIIQHGLAVKPGKPTIIAACEGKPVFGLPGNPVSALLVARQIVLPTLRYLIGEPDPLPTTIRAILQQNIASISGREDMIAIRIVIRGGEMLAEPIFGKSNLIYTLLHADGIIHIPLNTTGYLAGTEVEVTLL